MADRTINVRFPERAENGEMILHSFSVEFTEKEKELYEKVKDIPGKDLNRTLVLFSFKQLKETAKKKNQSIDELIKTRFKERVK